MRQNQRVIPVTKKGGFLPFFLPLLESLVVVGGAALISKAVDDAKDNHLWVKEQRRHDLAVEQSAKKRALFKTI